MKEQRLKKMLEEHGLLSKTRKQIKLYKKIIVQRLANKKDWIIIDGVLFRIQKNKNLVRENLKT
jgi:hypothetical protein